MIRHLPSTIPRLVDGESQPLIALTSTYGLYIIKVTHYDAYDEESSPRWCTACSSAFSIEQSEIIWWAYADEIQALIEAHSGLSLSNHRPGQF